MRAVPREAFMPEELAEFAYEDTPLPIEEGQTISQPYIVALMIAAIRAGATGPGARDRHRLGVRRGGAVPGGRPGLYGRTARGAGRPGAPPPPDPGIRQRRGAPRRRQPRLAGACAVRRDHRDGGRAARAAAAARAARRRRPPRDSDRARPAPPAPRPGDSRRPRAVRGGAARGGPLRSARG